MKFLALVFLSVFLAGCASTGSRAVDNKLSELEVGKTTIPQVQGKFGVPTATRLAPDGTRKLYYVFTRSKANPQPSTPVAVPPAGGVGSRTYTIIFTFTSAGILQDYEISRGRYDSETQRIER